MLIIIITIITQSSGKFLCIDVIIVQKKGKKLKPALYKQKARKELLQNMEQGNNKKPYIALNMNLLTLRSGTIQRDCRYILYV